MALLNQTHRIIIVTTVITTIVLFLALKLILASTFMNLETKRALTNMRRVLAAIDHDLKNLDSTVFDWATWDESYDFIKTGDKDFINTSIIKSTFEGLNINLLIFVDTHSRIIAAGAYDLDNEKFIDIPSQIKIHIKRRGKLVLHKNVEGSVAGFLRLGNRAMMLASRPIVTGDQKGPIRGAVIMGRYLSNKGVSELGKRLGLDLSMKVMDQKSLSAKMEGKCQKVSGPFKVCIKDVSGEVLKAQSVIKDINGVDSILVQINSKMTIVEKGHEAFQYFAVALVSSSILFLLINFVFMGRSAKSLMESEEKYRNLVAHSPGIVALVEDGKIAYANRAFSELLGYDSPLAMEGLNFFDLVEDDFRSVMEYQLTLASETKRVFPFSEHSMKTKDGSQVHLEATVIPVNIDKKYENQKTFTQYVAIDVTEKRAAQLALVESEKRYRSVVEDQTELICRYEPDGKLIFVNEAYCRYFEKRKEDLLGSNFLVLLPEEDRKVVKKYIGSFKPGHETSSIAHRVIGPDNSIRWLEWTDRAIIDEHGEVIGFQAVGRDITTLRSAYQQLQNSRQRLSYLLSSSPAVIYTCEPGGDFGATFISENVIKQTGWRPQDFIDSPSFWMDHIHPDDLENVMENSKQILTTGHMSHEYRFLTKSGAYLWMRDELITIRNERGNPQELVGSWIDITERRNAEEKIKSSLKEKEALLQEVHHRVKNNLQIMSSLLDLQSSEVKDPEDAVQFQDAQGRIWSMALAHEKLYLSENLSEIPMDEYITDLALDVVTSYSTFHEGAQVVSDVEPISLGIDKAAPCGLIVYELVSNCMKHAFPGRRPGLITVIIIMIDDLHINLIVKDDGVGLSAPKDLSQAKSFGLRLVFNLVEQLDGTVAITASNGTEVDIKIPMKSKTT